MPEFQDYYSWVHLALDLSSYLHGKIARLLSWIKSSNAIMFLTIYSLGHKIKASCDFMTSFTYVGACLPNMSFQTKPLKNECLWTACALNQSHLNKSQCEVYFQHWSQKQFWRQFWSLNSKVVAVKFSTWKVDFTQKQDLGLALDNFKIYSLSFSKFCEHEDIKKWLGIILDTLSQSKSFQSNLKMIALNKFPHPKSEIKAIITKYGFTNTRISIIL